MLLQQLPLPEQLAPVGLAHVPAFGVPAAQQTCPAVHANVPAQTPLVQTSPVVQPLLSLQVVPFGLLATPHTPAVQVACWHWLLGVGQSAAVLHVRHPTTGVPTHTPLLHVSFVVHGLPSLQVAPLGLLAMPQMLLVHVACWHSPVGAGQSFALWQVTQPATGVPAQTPAAVHTSLSVHGLPSLHVEPAGLVTTAQTPAVQTACWHWSAGAGQSFALWQVRQPWISVPAHTPAVHTSLSVHGLASSHAVLSGLFSTTQNPCGPQTARWH